MKISRPVIFAVVIVAIIVVSGAYYFTSVGGGNAANSVTVNIVVTAGLLGQNSTYDTYAPRNFTVTEGQHVTIVVQNTDDGPHSLTIPQFNVNTGILQGGQTGRVSFTPNQVGTFEYFEPAGVCNSGGIGAQQGGCTGFYDANGKQGTTGNMTVKAPAP